MIGLEPTRVRTARSNSFFEAAEAAYHEAVERGSEEADHYIRIAGRTIRLTFAGKTLEKLLLPAFAHIEVASVESPDLTLRCWDDASTSVSTPEPPPTQHDGLDFVDESVRIAWDPPRRSLSLFDPARTLALLRFPDSDSATVWEQAAPAHRILHWWAGGLGMQLVHAAVVGLPAGGVMLVGRGGSGKSTTALACVGSALGYLADDYCVISLDEGPCAHSLYSTGKADVMSVSLLPSLADAFAMATPRIDGKRVIFGARDFPASLLRSCPLRAIVVPTLGSRPELARIPGAHALRMVAPSTMMQLPGDRAATLSRLATVVRAVPCYELVLGPDPYAAIPLLESLSRGEVA